MFLQICGCLFLFSLLAYVGQYLIHAFVTTKPRNLKELFGSEWALVTGGSSGIGLALVEELCGQGINVFIVAKEDALLVNSVIALKEKFPERQILSLGVDLGDVNAGYMAKLADQTKNLKINLVFNNAGYIKMGLFADESLESIMNNTNVNLTACIRITHLFSNRMLDEGLRGAICFTSSSSCFMPTPTSAIYSSTKAFLTQFATSIAGELRPSGIHVMVVHPSPTDTNFYSTSAGVGTMEAIQKTAVSAEVVARAMLSSVGRTVIKDLGYFTVGVRLLLKVLDFNLLAEITGATGGQLEEFKKLRKDRPLAKKTK